MGACRFLHWLPPDDGTGKYSFTKKALHISILERSKFLRHKLTRSWAIAEGPRDASCVLKSCQLPRNSAETTWTTSPEQIEVMKSECYTGPLCCKHVHSTVTPSSPFCCPVGVMNKPTTVELWISPVYRRLAVASISYRIVSRNVLSPQYSNCSRDPDHAHLGNTHSSQD